MTRPSSVTLAAVLAYSGAMALALGSFAFFLVGVLVATGDESGQPVSVAIVRMALAGGFLLMLLALVAGCAALNARELRDWARTISLAEIAASTRERLRSAVVAIAAMCALGRSWLAEFVSSHKSRRVEHHP